MLSIVKSPHGLLLFALAISGMELFAWFYLYQGGYLHELVGSDKSLVSLLIILIYTVATLHFLDACRATSRQFADLDQRARRAPGCRLIDDFLRQIKDHGVDGRRALLEVLDTRLRGRYAFGFVIADLMLKLGILGTVIGFIYMLGSLANLNSVDITVMQTLLAEMSGGMKVALFTTLTGMLAGILLNIKYNLVDWAVDHLVNDVREIMIHHD
jgi:hypothetical protein